jgi:P-type Cu+ transporter
LRAGSANMETLVSLGTIAAYSWSVFSMLQQHSPDAHPTLLYFEASVVVLAMVRLGKTLEAKARARALEALEGLIHLDNSPVDAWQPATDSWQRVAPESLSVDAIIRIHPHEPISLDGEIVSGQTEIDESAMTGESLPAVRGPGQRVFAGSLNLSGMIQIRCSAAFSDSRRAQIGNRILAALSTRAPIAALADRVAAVFVPVVLVIAALTAITHIGLDHGAATAIQNAVAVLVVACPCALGLATPAAIAAGLARSAQHGWLFRSADAMQRAASINHVVFDKTGTLTSGRPHIVGLRSAGGVPDPLNTEMGSWPDWLAAAAAAERGIEHPLAGALLSYAAGRPMPDVLSVENQPGSGVLATVGGARAQQVMVGKPAWIAVQLEQASAAVPPAVGNDFEDATAIDVAIDGQWAGRLWVADSLRPDAAPTLLALKQKGYRCTILSGDRTSAVRRASKQLNDTPFFAEKTPEQKSEFLEECKSRGDRVAMVGDGVNDAAAMAHAHLGVAMAAGASLTLQTADLTLSSSSQLLSVSQSLALSKAVMRRVKENLVFAFGFNILALPLAAMGHLSPVIAGTAMALSSAAVMLNAIRLLGWKP